MRIISLFIIIAIVILGVSFATLNSSRVIVDYYVGQSSLPISLIIVIAFTVGCLVGIAASAWLLIKAKIKIIRLEQKLQLSEKEIENLRAIPLKKEQY